MLEPASAKHIGWQCFWFAIQHEVEEYHNVDNSRPYIIKPGEFAHSKGVVLSDFWTFLQRNGYKLTEDERWIIKHASISKTKKLGKPVIVLKRLGGGNYLVCRMSSWGGNFQVAKLFSPLQRYFAFSLSESLDQWPPGTNYLRCSPPVKRTSAVMALPVESKDVKPIDWRKRAFLSIGQLERLEAMVERRAKTFRSVAEELRRSEVEVQKRKRMPTYLWSPDMRESFRKAEHPYLDDPEAPGIAVLVRPRMYDVMESLRLIEGEPAKSRDNNASRLPIQGPMNLINWAYKRGFEDFVNYDFHIDPASPLGVNVDYNSSSKRYRLPRVAKGPGRASVSRSVLPIPLVLRSAPSARHIRSFSSTARLCGRGTKLPLLSR